MDLNRVFAVGLGFSSEEDGCIFYEKVFIHTEQNDFQVKDFLSIIKQELLVGCTDFPYDGSNITISLAGKDLSSLKQAFIEKNHKASVDFIGLIEQNVEDIPIICIMTSNEPPTTLEESYLVLKLFSDGILNALNPEHRLPLTKVFGGLPTIEMSMAGIPCEIGAHDKFLSWIMFNDFGNNRFAPTSFVRFGAHLGNGNTLMFGVSVNMGASIGDNNLLDGHCSIASCVQIGDLNKIGSFVSMEGVLSPVNEHPVVVGDNNFFGTRCRVGTGLVIGNNNFWGSGVDISKGTPLKDLRDSESLTFGGYVKAGSDDGIQGQNETMIIINRSRRNIPGTNVKLYPGEYLLYNNSEDNQSRFARNDDLNSKN